MPERTPLTLHVNLKTLLIVLAVATPLLVADMFLVLDRSEDDLTATIGNYTETIARGAASEVSRWVHGRVNEARVVAAIPEVRRIANEANRAYSGLNEQAIQSRLERVDRDWETPRAAPVVARMLDNPASVYLRNYIKLNPTFRRLLVTDQEGAAIAGSHKSIDYNQSDEDWWIAGFGDGRAGRIYIEDVRVDPITRTNFTGINLPILDAAGERVIGVLRAIVDVSAVGPAVARVQLGGTGHAMLIRTDGTFIAARDVSANMERKAEESELLGLRADQVSGYGDLLLKGGARKFVGFAHTDLSIPFPDLRWAVLVSQDYAEATAPIAAIRRRLLLSAFLAIAVVGILAVYFSIHRPQEVVDLEEVQRE